MIDPGKTTEWIGDHALHEYGVHTIATLHSPWGGWGKGEVWRGIKKIAIPFEEEMASS